MKTILALIGLLAVVGGIWYYNSSPTERTKAKERIDLSLNHGGEAVWSGDDVPKIVAEQRHKELVRQNTQWTTENQALHPIEYCQAQLDTIAVYGRKLEAILHEVTVRECSTRRSIEDCEANIESIKTFMKVAKDAYRQAESSNSWPVVVNGFALSQEKAQEKIVDAAQRLEPLASRINSMKNQLVMLSKKRDRIVAEQKKVVKIRENIQTTLSDLQTKQVIDGSKEIIDAIAAINDSMTGLGGDAGDPSIEDLIVPDKAAAREKTFLDIMKE